MIGLYAVSQGEGNGSAVRAVVGTGPYGRKAGTIPDWESLLLEEKVAERSEVG